MENNQAFVFRNMIISGANNLQKYRTEIDDLNVYPVPDGDTGTNMGLTIGAVAKELEDKNPQTTEQVAAILESASLRGARGNSGVILSQLFRGFSKAIKKEEVLNTEIIANAFKSAADTAYKAVMKPTEGTILTVARGVADAAMTAKNGSSDFNSYVSYIVDEGNKVLFKTTEMLPALKKAGVVDAGGKGLMRFLEGALYYLVNGEVVEASAAAEPSKKTEAADRLAPSDIVFAYCTEFIITKTQSNVSVKSFRKSIEHLGDCMVVIEDDDIVKVHIHTNDPGIVIQSALRLGALINIKIDNMRAQAEEEQKAAELPKEPPKELGFVAVSAGEGINKMLYELGVDEIIFGGQTMNPSTDDILNAINSVNANNVFVFPNNKNIILAAKQAAELTEKNVYVVESKSVCQAVSCMLCMNTDNPAEEIYNQMQEQLAAIKIASVTFAARDSEAEGKIIKNGDILGITEKGISFVGSSADSVLKDIVKELTNEDTSYITIFYGEDVSADEAEKVSAELSKEYPDLEILINEGGQPLYYYFVSAE